MRILKFFIGLVFWLWLFIIPTGMMGLLGFLLYKKSVDNLLYFIFLSAFGIIAGVVLAEHIRKKYGLDYFFSRVIATPELDEKEDQ